MLKFTRRLILILGLLFLLAACGSDGGGAAEESADVVQPTVEPPTSEPAPTDVPIEPTDAPVEPTDVPVEPTDAPPTEAPMATEEPVVEVVEEPTAIPATSTPEPTEPPPPTETPTPEPTEAAGSLTYNLLQTELTEKSPLYVSPKNSATVVPVELSIGEKVSVMGRNGTGSHLRVVWNTGVGWVPTGFTTLNGDRNRMEALPIYDREPPQCAVPITTQWSLGSEWETPQRSRVAVVVDLFRSRYGEFPDSSLALTVNGVVIEESRRAIEENGQFSLKDVVLTLPGFLQPDDTLGYVLDTTTEEPLVFVASIFDVPENCIWDID